MTISIGLDWAGKGWFGIILRENGNHESTLFPSLLNVWSQYEDANRILIDIPVGLQTDSKRRPDEHATEKLKPDRDNSVFSTPVREAVYAKTLKQAKDHNEEYGFSISNQAWAICLRIREVDTFFDAYPEAIGTVRESHPEVCFAALNEDTPMQHGKKTDDGRTERKEVLFEADPSLKSVYEKALETYLEPPSWARRLSKNAKDDVLDALVLAYTARRDEKQLATLPDDPDVDTAKANPLPIEIVYPQA